MEKERQDVSISKKDVPKEVVSEEIQELTSKIFFICYHPEAVTAVSK